MLLLVNVCLFISWNNNQLLLRVCLEPVMDGRLQGYARCGRVEAEWLDIAWRTKRLFLFSFFFFLLTQVGASVFSLSLQDTTPAHQLRFWIQYFKKAQSLILRFFLFFFFSGLTQTLNLLEWQFRQFPSQHETDCARQLWVGDGTKWLPPPFIAPFFFVLYLCKMMRRQCDRVHFAAQLEQFETAVEGFVIRCRDASAAERSW